jgi:3-hydroxyacyl-CoA dehydrogenase
MRWGFGMKQGPFELWQEAGWLEVAKMVQEDIDAGKALCKAPLPAGCSKARWPRPAACTRPRLVEPGTKKFVPRRVLPVYERQLFPEKLLGETACPTGRRPAPRLPNQGAAHLDAGRPGLIASIKNKMHAISPEVMEGLMEAVDTAESDYQGMVIWSGDAPFSVGADLEATMPAFVIGGADAIESIEQSCRT